MIHNTKTYLCNFDPLIPHLYIIKLGFTGVYFFFLISAQKHRLWVPVRITAQYPLEPPREKVLMSTTIYVLSRTMKKYQRFLSENFQFSIYLNRCVFVNYKCKKIQHLRDTLYCQFISPEILDNATPTCTRRLTFPVI